MSPTLNAVSEPESSRLGEQQDMSKTTTIAKMRLDGSVVEVLADGSERPLPDTPMRPIAPEEIEKAARADPAARPMTSEELANARRVPRVKTLRRALGLAQEESPRVTASRWAPCAIGSKAARNPTSPPALISPSSPTTPRACGGRYRAVP